MAISILVPTRGRPESVNRLWSSAFETETMENEFIFYVDEDDPESFATCARYGTVVQGPRIVLSEMWNVCYEHASNDIFMHCGDDIVFRTDGWDYRVQSTFDSSPDNIILVHGRDGYQDRNIATHGFYHRDWVETVGYFMPPYFSSDYNDLWWTEVADALGRRVFLEDVYTEHMHPVAGKGTFDQTHRERLERHQRDNVEFRYRQLANERQNDIAKLRRVILDRRAVR